MHRKRNGGLSLVDVLIVLATLAVIAVLLVPQYNEKKARERRELEITQARTDLLAIKRAQEKYFEKNGRFAGSLMELGKFDSSIENMHEPFGPGSYEVTSRDSTQFDITCTDEEIGAIEAGVPTWLGDPGEEELRADLIKRSRNRMEKISRAQQVYFDSLGVYTSNLDSLEIFQPGTKNLLCALMMRRFSIILPDSGTGFEVTSHLDEVGRIVNGDKEYPPLPTKSE
jgi:Tfp pilus assembly protein PilE